MTSLSGVPAGPVLPKAPTGVPGLDEITGGGLPAGRSTLVTGGPGTGKTLLAVQFLVAGAREYGEPGVLVTFEESAGELAANVASLGFDLDGLQRDGLLVIHGFPPGPPELAEAGAFGLDPLFLLLDDAITRVGARRVALDTIEALFGAFQAQATVRREVVRLLRWLKDRAVTAIVTGERDGDALTRYGIEAYVSDCVIALDRRIHNEVATRRLEVVKYRGSAHGTNQYPFLITGRGFTVLPVPSVALAYGASWERVSTGVPGLDDMLCGGLFRGSAVLVSGSAGTGKSTLGAHLIDAACARGERALLIQFEESPGEVIRNMASAGIDLERWVQAGLLRTWAVRSSEFGLDNHLAMVSGLVAEHEPAVAVVDGIGSLISGHARGEVTLMLARKFHLFKARGITAMATVLTGQDAETAIGGSSRADTWLQLRTVETGGKRKRLLCVLKSRGSAHSDQAREFVLTGHGVELGDEYDGPAEVTASPPRLAQEARERGGQQPQSAAQGDGMGQVAGRGQSRTANDPAATPGRGTQRRADPPDPDDGQEQR